MLRLLVVLIIGLFIGFNISYIVFFHTIPQWMIYSSLGGLVGSIMGILLLPK